MKKKFLSGLLAIFIGVILFFPVSRTLAQSAGAPGAAGGAAGGAAPGEPAPAPVTSIVPSGGTGPTVPGGSEREYTFCDLLSVLVRIAALIISSAGALALLFFIIGSMLLISSSGSSQKVEKGKSYIRNAVIGLVIVMLSYSIVGVFLVTLIGGTFKGAVWISSAASDSITSQCAVSPILEKIIQQNQ